MLLKALRDQTKTSIDRFSIRVGAMLSSLVDSSKCAHVKKRVYMPRVADEYNSSSQPLNGKDVGKTQWC